MNQETIGGIKIGSSQADVIKVLGQPTHKTKAQWEEATGDTVTTWKWPGVDIELAKTGKKLRVALIHVTAPSTLTTSRGVHIGSSRAEIQAGYRRSKDKTDDANSYLVGSSAANGLAGCSTSTTGALHEPATDFWHTTSSARASRAATSATRPKSAVWS